MKRALKRAGKGKKAKRNLELQEAIELERKGYSKPDMTQDELREEKRWIAQQYSLDFMIDDADIQEDHEIQEIIRSEITKTKEQKIQDLSNLDGNLELLCGTSNGFISAVFHLLSYNEEFAKFFIQNGDADKTKPFSNILAKTFS